LSSLNTSQPSATPDVVYSPPPDVGLDLVYQDEYLIAVNKPTGLLSVPGRGAGRDDCLISRVQQRFADALIVHRLDMATSGLLLLARGPDMQRHLSLQFQKREIDKRYMALVHGHLAQVQGEVDLPLITDWPNRPMQMVCHERGKPSQTRYVVLAQDAAAQQSRVELEPLTGRSHQLRVHMLALGHAMVGDPLYGDQAQQGRYPRLMLHACMLALAHPVTGVRLTLHSAPPF
jgi:tRNA pseudouridine32 synthase/23S rRNA pseudouridine746 synthase